MDHPPLLVLGYSEAAMLLRQQSRPAIGAVISIHGGREFGVETDIQPRLDLSFDDVEAVSADDPVSQYRARQQQRAAAKDGLSVVAPCEEDVKAIIAFARQIAGVEGAVLCHCAGGVSRSAAAALICTAVWRGEGSEQSCVEELLRLRRGANPHRGLVRLADAMLERGGRLIAAVDAGQR